MYCANRDHLADISKGEDGQRILLPTCGKIFPHLSTLESNSFYPWCVFFFPAYHFFLMKELTKNYINCLFKLVCGIRFPYSLPVFQRFSCTQYPYYLINIYINPLSFIAFGAMGWQYCLGNYIAPSNIQIWYVY